MKDLNVQRDILSKRLNFVETFKLSNACKNFQDRNKYFIKIVFLHCVEMQFKRSSEFVVAVTKAPRPAKIEGHNYIV